MSHAHKNPGPRCLWTLGMKDWNAWQAACRPAHQLFEFNEGGPGDNKFVFCPYCGLRLKEAKTVQAAGIEGTP